MRARGAETSEGVSVTTLLPRLVIVLYELAKFTQFYEILYHFHVVQKS